MIFKIASVHMIINLKTWTTSRSHRLKDMVDTSGCSLSKRNNGRITKPFKVMMKSRSQVRSGQQLVRLVDPPGTVVIGPEKEHRIMLVMCSEMDRLISDWKWDELEQYQQLIVSKYPFSVDVKLNIIMHSVSAHLEKGTVLKSMHRLLKESQEVIPNSTCHQYFQVEYLGWLSKLSKVEKKYGKVEECMRCIEQKSQMYLPEKIISIQKRRDAEYLIHQFQNKFFTNSVRESIFKRFEYLLVVSLERASKVWDFFRKSPSTKK